MATSTHDKFIDITQHLERPFVLTDAQGRPEWIYLAILDKGVSGNIAIRLENR